MAIYSIDNISIRGVGAPSPLPEFSGQVPGAPLPNNLIKSENKYKMRIKGKKTPPPKKKIPLSDWNCPLTRKLEF